MPGTQFARLRHHLKDLHTEGALVALKTGTEVEDMSFEEIRLLRAISDNIVPLFVKIGGPEARNDIRELARCGVDGLIAPMIESPFALVKFIESLQSVLGPVQYDRIVRGINIETITACRQLEEILTIPEAGELNQITAARTDLSGSLDLHPDEDRVMDLCAQVVARARFANLRTSVGGKIHSGIIEKIVTEVLPDTVNTRHMVMDCSLLTTGNAAELVERNLRFELDLYEYLATMPSPRQACHAARADTIRNRMEAQTPAREHRPHPATTVMH
ncbi:MAG: aldolase [Leptospiraceae bacterium]|nr:aldolase [Leptospiraceae bacterium]MCB1314588.1 aldolase [Leptospiraceae bacterium]